MTLEWKEASVPNKNIIRAKSDRLPHLYFEIELEGADNDHIVMRSYSYGNQDVGYRFPSIEHAKEFTERHERRVRSATR
jgi:hypothetical protein